jgi:hypothetical protein
MKKICYFLIIILCSCGRQNIMSTTQNKDAINNYSISLRDSIYTLNNNIGIPDSISAVFYKEIIDTKELNFSNYGFFDEVERLNNVLLLNAYNIKRCEDIEIQYKKGVFIAMNKISDYPLLSKQYVNDSKWVWKFLDICAFLDSLSSIKQLTIGNMPSKFHKNRYPPVFGYSIHRLTIKYVYGGKSSISIPNCSNKKYDKYKLIETIEVPYYYIYDIKIND